MTLLRGLALALLALLLATPAFAKEFKDMSAGFVYVSPIGDGGWSHAHDDGRKALEKLGMKTFFQEAVPEGPDAERVIRNMARKNPDIIFTTSFGYMDPTLKVAKEFPKIVFMHCSGFKRAENVGTYFGRMYQARYLSGLVAGAMTKSGKLGYVAAFPIPEVIRGINAFTLGVRKANPQAEVRVVWTKTWYDPATEKQAAQGLLDVGCDVLAQHQDSPAAAEAAQAKGAWFVGYNTDMTKFAPKAHLTAPVWNWAPLYTNVARQVREGVWKSEALWPGIESQVVGLAPMGPMVPADVQSTVTAARNRMAAEGWDVFTGPVKDQSGAVKIADGKKATDEELLGMTWFVQGVVGSVQ